MNLVSNVNEFSTKMNANTAQTLLNHPAICTDSQQHCAETQQIVDGNTIIFIVNFRIVDSCIEYQE